MKLILCPTFKNNFKDFFPQFQKLISLNFFLNWKNYDKIQLNY